MEQQFNVGDTVYVTQAGRVQRRVEIVRVTKARAFIMHGATETAYRQDNGSQVGASGFAVPRLFQPTDRLDREYNAMQGRALGARLGDAMSKFFDGDATPASLAKVQGMFAAWEQAASQHIVGQA
ncbi:hypothetical protein ACXR2T_09975 [Leucobacter sp. HY1910]